MVHKQIQVPESLFINAYKLINALNLNDLPEDVQSIAKELELQINAKLEAMNRRDLYTKSKISASEHEKEEARKKYLEDAGVHPEWRY